VGTIACACPIGRIKHRRSYLFESLDFPWPLGIAPYTLYCDPPFMLPFLRRNEAAVAVVETP